MFGYRFKGNFDLSRTSKLEDFKPLISQSDSTETLGSPPRTRLSQFYLAFFLTLCLPFAAFFGVWLGNHRVADLTSLCAEQVSQYSPIVKDIGLKYEIVAFNGSLLKRNIFRQDAGPEVDAVWASLGVDYRSVIIPSDQAERSGLSTDQVRLNDKYGGGYPANVEGLHHLHCLNLLRQSLYYNFNYYHERGEGAFKNTDDILRFHVSHCLDILRQQLMCTVDIGVLGQVWWDKDQPKAYPDFNTKHKCRNFDTVRQWAQQHQAPADVPFDYLRPPTGSQAVYGSIP